MQYTITVNSDSQEAAKFMEFVMMLANTYTFLKIEENEAMFSDEQEKEIDTRFKEAILNPEKGKTWDELENNLEP